MHRVTPLCLRRARHATREEISFIYIPRVLLVRSFIKQYSFSLSRPSSSFLRVFNMVHVILLPTLLNVLFTLLPTLTQGAAIDHLHTRAKFPKTQYQMNIDSVTWDKSCKDPNPSNPSETKQDFVVRGWAGALELAADAQDRFQATKKEYTNPGPNGPTSLSKRLIGQEDPA